MANIIRLNANALNLAILNNSSVSLAAVCAQERSGWELEVEGAGELALWVAEEADSGFLVGVEGLAPGVHADFVRKLGIDWMGKGERTRKHH